MNNNLKGTLILLLTAFIWGSAFVAQTDGMNYVGPLTFLSARFLLGGIVLCPVIFCMRRFAKLKDAAAETGLTYSCLRRWILAGEFKDYVKAGNRIYVNMEKLVDYLNSAHTRN